MDSEVMVIVFVSPEGRRACMGVDLPSPLEVSAGVAATLTGSIFTAALQASGEDAEFVRAYFVPGRFWNMCRMRAHDDEHTALLCELNYRPMYDSAMGMIPSIVGVA